MKTLLTTLALVLCGASANAITYTVDLTLAGEFDYDTGIWGQETVHLTGSIETDGTLGTLNSSNFLSWTFTSSDSNSTHTISSDGLQGTVETFGLSNLSATATELKYVAGYWYFAEYSNNFFGSLTGSGQRVNMDVYTTIRPASGSQGSVYPPDRVLGRVAPIPLPPAAAMLLLGVGVLGMGGRLKHRA